MEGRDMGDSDILQSTRVENNDRGQIQYRTTLPSGRELTSEFMNPDDAKGKVLISWCDHVRQQIDADNAEAKAERDRGDIGIDTAEVERNVEVTPLQYVTKQRDLYQEQVNRLERSIRELQDERKTAREELEQWERVVDSLRGETDE